MNEDFHDRKYRCFYSELSAKQNGCALYETKDGIQRVSEIVQVGHVPCSKWKDLKELPYMVSYADFRGRDECGILKFDFDYPEWGWDMPYYEEA